MKNIVRICLITGLLTGSALFARAEDPATPAPAPAAKKAHSAASATTEAKKLTPEERKARIEARLKDLRAKKASGKITEKESQQLERLEKRAGAPAAGGKAAGRPHKATPAKADSKPDTQGASK